LPDLRITPGGPGDDVDLLALFDEEVAWLVARGQTGQWGTQPFSEIPARRQRVREWATGDGLWFANGPRGERAGALVVGDAPDYVPPSEVPELYVVVLLTAPAWRGRGVGALLVEHAARLARERQATRLRVDCWAGVPELPAAYERLGFDRVGAFTVRDWPGAILTRPLD